MTAIGLITALLLLVTGHKPTKYGYCICFEIGERWGGLSLGFVIITDKSADNDTKNHEHGHAMQNIIYGVLMPFLVGVPSVMRYWYREYLVNVKGLRYNSLPPYDSAWYEGQATRWGNELINK